MIQDSVRKMSCIFVNSQLKKTKILIAQKVSPFSMTQWRDHSHYSSTVSVRLKMMYLCNLRNVSMWGFWSVGSEGKPIFLICKIPLTANIIACFRLPDSRDDALSVRHAKISARDLGEKANIILFYNYNTYIESVQVLALSTPNPYYIHGRAYIFVLSYTRISVAYSFQFSR